MGRGDFRRENGMTDPADMIAWMDTRLLSLHAWMADHGTSSKKPRTADIIAIKQNDIAKFEELRAAYVRALEKRNAA